MIYIGNNEVAAFALMKINRQNPFRTYKDLPVESGAKLTDHLESLIADSDDSYVIDLSSFVDPEEIIVDAIDRLCRATNCDIIVYAPGIDPDATMLVSLQAIGYSKIITEAENQTLLLNQLKQAFAQPHVRPENVQEELIQQRDDVYDTLYAENPVLAAMEKRQSKMDFDELNELFSSELKSDEPANSTPDSEPKPNDTITKEERPIKNPVGHEEPVEKETSIASPKRQKIAPVVTGIARQRIRDLKIAVVGSMERIGTTTLAFQLVKYFNDRDEHSAAYLQYNDSSFMDDLREYFNVDLTDEKIGKISFANTALFDDPTKVKEITASGYHYIVYDYGNIDSVNKSSVFEKDIIILIGGGEPDEFAKMTDAIKVFNQKNVFYFFNFTGPGYRAEILNLMEEKRNKTFFMDYIPDRFSYSPALGQDFSQIMRSDYEMQDLTTGKEKRLGRIFRK